MCCLEGSRHEGKRSGVAAAVVSDSVSPSSSYWPGSRSFRGGGSSPQAVRNYRLVPERAGELIGRTLPAVEVAAGALLAVGLGVRPVAALLALFLVAFSVAVAVNLLRGRTIDCGCFGPVAEKQITWWTVARNLVLTAAAIVVAAVQPTALALDRLLPGTPRPDIASGSAGGPPVATAPPPLTR